MKPSCRKSLAAGLAAVALALCGAGAAAAPKAVEAFEAGTWPALSATLKQPAVVVFSTTDCAHCPAVFDRMHQQIRQRKLGARLIAVVMDRAPGEDDATLLADGHYQQADRLFGFAGQPAALRFAVEPRWRGVTPYVVFLAPGAPARAVTGPPSDEDVSSWASAFAKPAGKAKR